MNSDKKGKILNRFVRWLLVISGFIFTGLAILGIFLPLLPTTPFLLLAAACFGRSSERFYHWLISNRWFGIYIKNYKEGKGIPVRVKIVSVSFLWLTIGFSSLFIVENMLIRIIFVLLATAVTIHIISIRS